MFYYKITILDNKKCKLETDDDELFDDLRDYLSYKIPGVEYTKAFKRGWDGKKFLLAKSGMFSIGLLDLTKNFLKQRGIIPPVTDRRPPVITNDSIDIKDKLKKLKLIPREHQVRILQKVIKHDRGIVRSCTGSGKSVCTAMATAEFNKPTIIYVIGIDLLKQFHDLFSAIFDEKIGMIGNGVCDIERINIASIWTIGSALKISKNDILIDEDKEEDEADDNNVEKIINMLRDAKIHIFDESHTVTTNTINQIYKQINPERIYGFSGTPYRDDIDNLSIHSILGRQIINISASELIQKGILAQPIIKFVDVPPLGTTYPSYQGIYKNFIVDNDVRNNLIVKEVESLLEKGYLTLVLYKQIRHGKKLYKMLNSVGIKTEVLSGDDSLERRTEVKEMLMDKKIQVILASTIFDLGVDIPALSGLVLCGGGKSSIRALQRIGRVIRGYPGKKFAAIVDFYDRAKFLRSHSKIRCKIYASEEGFRVIKCKNMK